MHSGLPLDDLAHTIVVCFDKSGDYRITAGQHLLEAQERVRQGEAGAIKWTKWYKWYVGSKTKETRSLRDAARCMKIAASPNPFAAHEAENKRRREAKRDVAEPEIETPCPILPDRNDRLAKLVAIWRDCDGDERAAFRAHIGS